MFFFPGRLHRVHRPPALGDLGRPRLPRLGAHPRDARVQSLLVLIHDPVLAHGPIPGEKEYNKEQINAVICRCEYRISNEASFMSGEKSFLFLSFLCSLPSTRNTVSDCYYIQEALWSRGSTGFVPFGLYFMGHSEAEQEQKWNSDRFPILEHE